jgi:hypothetical protein
MLTPVAGAQFLVNSQAPAANVFTFSFNPATVAIPVG